MLDKKNKQLGLLEMADKWRVYQTHNQVLTEIYLTKKEYLYFYITTYYKFTNNIFHLNNSKNTYKEILC